MYKLKLIVDNNERWLNTLHYEYFCPVKDNKDSYRKFLQLNFPFDTDDENKLSTYHNRNVSSIRLSRLDNELKREALKEAESNLTSLYHDDAPKTPKERYYSALTKLRYSKGLDHGIIPNIDRKYDRYIRPQQAICKPVEYNKFGGIFNLELASSSDDDFWYEWMLSSQLKNGRIEFYEGDGDMAFKIQFWDCFCISIGEKMSSHGNSAMMMQMRLSPAITQNRNIQHEKVWKITDIHQPWKPATAAPVQSTEKKALLVKKLEGPFTEDGKIVEELIMGNSYIYKATEYNDGEGYKLNNTQWSVELNNDGKLKELTMSNAFEQDGIICYKYTPEEAENIRVYAWCNEASKDVSVEVPVVCFPFCVDRFKVPGLNREGTNIAEDLTYGKGIATKTPNNVYDSESVERFKKEYIERGFDINKHAIFANVENLKENPFDKSFNHSTPSEGSDHFANVQREIDAQNNAEMMRIADDFDKVNYPKAIYSKERIYDAKAWLIKDWVYEDSGKDIKDYHEGNLLFWDTSDENIFKAFEEWATLCFSYGEMEGNIKRMIAKFKRNEGGIYEDPVLTNDIANHKATLEYCSNLEDFIAEKIKQSNGLLSKLVETDVDYDYNARGNRGKTTAKGTKFAKPTFGSFKDTIKGETIALNDIWATEVYVSEVQFDNDNYKINYEVTLWDHFGLDITDIEDIPNTVPLAKEAFAAWFALQHLRGYKPFVTKITFTKEFEGNINEGKIERNDKREALKVQQVKNKIDNLPEFKSL